jgi:hypothetical protein
MPNARAVQDDFSLKEKLQYAALGLVLIGGSFFIGRNLLRNAAVKREATKSAKGGSPADYAQRIKMAFENDGWPGTDEEALRSVFREIPSKEVLYAVIRSYNVGGKNLMLDMKGELTTTEYNEMLAIIAGKPDKITINSVTQISLAQYTAWAKRLKAAFDYTWWGGLPGTDEGAIRAVFLEIPTQADYEKVAAAYQSLFAQSLKDGLLLELELWEYGTMMTIIKNKPKA